MFGCPPAVFSFLRKKPTPPSPPERTFKERVESFWTWYAGVAERFYQTIEAGRCADLKDEIIAGIDTHLTHFSWVFGPGEGGQGHSLTLTAEGDPHRQFLTQYWVACAPQLAGWTFYPARQPGTLTRIVLERGGVRFDPLEFWLTPNPDEQEEKFDIDVWHPLFETMPEKDRWIVLFLFLDESLGEYGTQRWIGEIKLGKDRLAQSFPLGELHDYIERETAARHWKFLPPGETTTGFSTRETDPDTPRGDIFVGSSMHFRLVREFIQAKGNLPDPLAGTGADFIYVSFPASHLPRGEEVALRGTIEDALDERLRTARSGRLIGGAMGRQNAYIDLLVFDGARSLTLVADVLRAHHLPAGTTIHHFARERADRTLRIGPP